MIEKLRESRGWQFLLIAALILIVPLIVDINERVSVIRRMRQEQARLERELAEVEAEHQALQEEFEYVNGDAYLEQWARVDARMTKPGEVAIVPLDTGASGQTTSEDTSDPLDTDTPPSISEQWHRLFFEDAVIP